MSTQATPVTFTSFETLFLFPMQAIIKDYLYTDEWFLNFPIIIEDMENVPDAVDRACAGVLKGPNGKSGVTIMIHTLRGGGALPNVPGSFNMSAEALFIVVEQPNLNRGANTNGTGIPGLVVLETIIAVMKNFRSSETNTLFRDSDNGMSNPVIDSESGLVLHSVKMLFTGGIVDNTQVVTPPVISIDADTGIATMSCPTEGAEIYWTGDARTRPTQFGGTLYAGPVDANAITEVWARAYRPGWRASTIVMKDVRPALQSEDPQDLKSESGERLFG